MSVGKGFAFHRKQKVQQEYKKLLRKEKWRMKDSKPKLEEEYPEHLRHLYMAEQQRLNEEEQLNKERRRKGRSGDADGEESVFPSPVTTGSSEKSAVSLNEGPQTSQVERFVICHASSSDGIIYSTLSQIIQGCQTVSVRDFVITHS